ncbi:MAG TPA: hypothetical protein VGA21_01865 [Cyclobacteriaceae bacterium]
MKHFKHFTIVVLCVWMMACKENEVAKSLDPKFENQSFEENVLGM